jgi:hypothetical protein
MTAKEFVKSVYPKARSERHVGNDKKVYYLIRPNLYDMYIGQGNTESKAWTNAKQRTENKQKQIIEYAEENFGDEFSKSIKFKG